MRSKPVTIKVPSPVAEAIETLLARGTLGAYPSRNAAIVGLLTYTAIFPRLHDLTVGIARLPESDQDTIHDFIIRAVRDGTDLAALLTKPATANGLLTLAREAASSGK